MNPVVLIATHHRYEITKKNIESLMRQSVVPKIVLVVSDDNEARQYKKDFPNIDVSMAPNKPLGFKWQLGVNRAKMFNPDPLIINGSDDILGIGFIENACNLMLEYDFIGLQRWYVYYKNILYKYDYNVNMPLGGGRCYSAKLLEKINYKLFDTVKDKHLDDLGWRGVVFSGVKNILLREIEGMNIVSIKGDWPMLNGMDKFWNSSNLKLLSKGDKKDLKQLINYE